MLAGPADGGRRERGSLCFEIGFLMGFFGWLVGVLFQLLLASQREESSMVKFGRGLTLLPLGPALRAVHVKLLAARGVATDWR